MRQNYKIEVLRRALQKIKDTEEKMCRHPEMCQRDSCRQSNALWTIANEALKEAGLAAASDDAPGWKMNFMEWRDCDNRVYHHPHFYLQAEQPLRAEGLRRWYFCTGSVR